MKMLLKKLLKKMHRFLDKRLYHDPHWEELNAKVEDLEIEANYWKEKAKGECW